MNMARRGYDATAHRYKSGGVVFTVEVISAEQTSQTYLTPPSPPRAPAFLRMTPMSSSSVEDGNGDYEVSKDSESEGNRAKEGERNRFGGKVEDEDCSAGCWVG